MKTPILTTALVLGVTGLALAQNPPPANDPVATPRINQRQVNQEKRIGQGVSSGQLTAQEATRLGKMENKLQANKQAAKADGTVTPQERKQLHHQADRTSHAIFRQKHDRQRAK